MLNESSALQSRMSNTILKKHLMGVPKQSDKGRHPTLVSCTNTDKLWCLRRGETMYLKDKIFMNREQLMEHGPITIVAFGDSVTHGAFY